MSPETLRNQARMLMWLVTVPFAALSLLTVLLLDNIIWQGGRYAGPVAIHYLPMFLYMWAIWMVRVALKSIADGAFFNEVVPKLLLRIGIALLGGALFTFFGIPIVTALVEGRPYLRTFEASPVALGVIGAFLILFSNLLERAAAMRAELDEFF